MDPRRDHNALIRRLFVAAAMAGVVAALFANRERLDMSAMVEWVAGFGLLAPLVFTLVRAAGAVFFIPGSLMALSAGALFGPVWGAVYNLLASTLGAVLAFLVARYLAANWVERKLAGRARRIVEGAESEGWRFVAFVRLVPLFPYNLLNYALGITRIKLSHFTFASLVFMLPGDVAYVYLGYAGREALGGEKFSIDIALIALGLLAALVFLPSLVRRIRRNRAKAGG